jgi:hypothetical protein
VFVLGRPLQSTLMFESNVRSLPEAPGLNRKQKTRLERLARDKNSSLFGPLVNYGRKKFYNIGPSLMNGGSKDQSVLVSKL